ncbi:hypothetical protein ACFYXM_28060 [Streptomyces sp. NPDC002476]|uniref:hypothetical protein n=1 Tax=Streptomyces sp. NPDC002476 TaxID=3364648 RepID=UPI0036CC39E0
MSSKPMPIDADALLVEVNREVDRVRQARTRLALASLGLITARIRADRPTARFLELGFTVSMQTYECQAVAGRVWLSEAEETAGRWRACLDTDARADLEGWCTHIGQDAKDLLPTLWVKDQTTGLQVIDLDAVDATLRSTGALL